MFGSFIWIWRAIDMIEYRVDSHCRFKLHTVRWKTRNNICAIQNLLVNKKKSRNVYPRWCPCPWRWARSCRIYEIRFKAYIGGKKNRSHMWIIYHITWYQRFSFNLRNNDTNLVPKIVEIGFAYGTISWKVISKTI